MGAQSFGKWLPIVSATVSLSLEACFTDVPQSIPELSGELVYKRKEFKATICF